MKWIIIPLLISMVLFCGCTSVQPTVVETAPTPVTVTQTYIPTETPTETVGPAPTTNYSICFDHNITTPDFCYSRYYWVRPTVTPVGMGYTARVWRNSSCVDINKTSGECKQFGDDTWSTLFLHNLTPVRNISGVNISEIVAATTYYNNTFDLNKINSMDFSDFIKTYWDGTYPATPYNKKDFEPNMNVSIPVVGETFNPKAW